MPVRRPRAQTIPVNDEAWMRSAECRGVDPNLFFPEVGERTTDAVAVCDRCPVRVACLEYALDHGIKTGIWGGLGERKRRRIARERAAVAS